MLPAKTRNRCCLANLRLHIAGAGADDILDSALLRLALQIAKGALIPGVKGII